MSQLQPLLTVFLSGVVAALVSFALSTKKETFTYKQKKAEELYLAADQYIKDLAGVFLMQYPYVKGEMSEREMREMIVKTIKERPISQQKSHATIWMLVRFYFPATEPALLALDKGRENVNSALFSHTKRQTGLKPYDDAFVEFNSACDSFLEAIVLEGKKFSEMPGPFKFLSSQRENPQHN